MYRHGKWNFTFLLSPFIFFFQFQKQKIETHIKSKVLFFLMSIKASLFYIKFLFEITETYIFAFFICQNVYFSIFVSIFIFLRQKTTYFRNKKKFGFWYQIFFFIKNKHKFLSDKTCQFISGQSSREILKNFKNLKISNFVS